MTDLDLGKINIIKLDKGGNYIIFNNVVISFWGKLYLENQPITSRKGLIGTGTTYYRAKIPDSN